MERKAKRQPKPKRNADFDYPAPPWVTENYVEMSNKEALDTVLKICAERKRDIARGNYHTLEESQTIFAQLRKEKLATLKKK